MISRILMLICATFLMTYTTSPIALTDGLEALLSPLKYIKVPVHELSMMMCIALRFIPTLIEETDKIMSAQKARGADFETGNLMQKVKALIPILVPLFISAFRRADELATAMECRCYQGGEGRTKMKLLRYRRDDYVVFLLGILLLAAVMFVLFLPKENAACAQIYQDGRLIKTVLLSEDQSFAVEGRYCNTVTVRDGKIAVTASDCPGEDCVSCGWSDSAGRSIVCLPNRLEIRIVGESGDVDFVVR